MSNPPSAPDAAFAPGLGDATDIHLREIIASGELLEHWNTYEQERVKEEDSDLEGEFAYPTLDVVLEPGKDFSERYSHTDGLGALPRRPMLPTRSSEPPVTGEAKLAGKYEDAMRLGLKVERTRLLETDSDEVQWNYQGCRNFFPGWKPLVPYNLPTAGNLVQSIIEENQKRWTGVAIKVNVLGNGAEIGGFFWRNP